jgi:hypothetical protein
VAGRGQRWAADPARDLGLELRPHVDLAGRAAFILLWVGFMAIFRGLSAIMLAFALRRVAQGVPPAEALGLADEGAVIPAQERRTVPERTPESSGGSHGPTPAAEG